MRVIVTGMNGTVAPIAAGRLQRDGHEIVAWDRSRCSPDEPEAVCRFIDEHAPHALMHFAMGPAEWAATMARRSHELGLLYVYISSVSVFSSAQKGPFRTDDTPAPEDDYGRYKRDCETAVQTANPDSLIVRLGWQIGEAPGSNTMVHYLTKRHETDGRIQASRRWRPSCSFLEDTAEQLAHLVSERQTGLYHLEGNPGWTFHDIATALARHHHAPWRIEPTDVPDWDNRMVDHRVAMRMVSDRLSAEATPPRA